MIIHQDDGRYAHRPHCNKRCTPDGHWLLRDNSTDPGPQGREQPASVTERDGARKKPA